LASFTRHFDELSSDRFNALRESSFFDPVPSDKLADIAKLAEIKTFNAGKVIITEGSEINSFYVILFGNAIASVNNKLVGQIHGGECLGESVFFRRNNMLTSATVKADGQLIVAELKKSALDELEPDSKLYLEKALLLALFAKLQQANKTITQLASYAAASVN
jgi:CRP-like cAMP-binding protein